MYPEELNSEGPPGQGSGEGAPRSGPPDKEELKRAFKAFKKRLKLMRLDDESRLGNRSMTGGNRSGIVAIRPPGTFPKEIWEELCRQGKLKDAGRGLYELTTTGEG